jgi:CheY-like chemotaxis protein
MRVLVVEDDDFKFEDIAGLLQDLPEQVDLQRAGSVQASYDAIHQAQFDYIILDMALPSHNLVAGTGNPYPEPVGGLEILLELADQDRPDRVIILTQYPSIEFNREYIPLGKFPSVAARHGITLVKACILFGLDGAWKEQIAREVAQNENPAH